MTYFSPFHFLSHQPGQTTWEPTDLSRARKRVLAELALNPDAYGGDRNALLAQLEGLDNETLCHHQWIYTQKPLLNFLENRGMKTALHWPALNDQLAPNSSRRAFVLERFARTYAGRLTEFIRSGSAGEAEQFALIEPVGLTFRQQRRWLAPVADILGRIYAQMQELSAQLNPETVSDIINHNQVLVWCDPSFGYRLEAVPAVFEPYRDEIILALNNIGHQLSVMDKKNEISHETPTRQVDALLTGLYQVVHRCNVSKRCVLLLKDHVPTGRFDKFKPQQ